LEKTHVIYDTRPIRKNENMEDSHMKALALLSGGLDSILAVKLIQEQRIDVVALNFTSPFCLCGKDGCGATGIAKQLKIPLKVMRVGKDYIKMLRNPKYGYGKNMNPCIDCRIFMFKKAKEYAEEIGASFLFTGEVLNERPMSQHRKALNIIDEETGLEGRILRPLSAKLLPETEVEKKGLVNRQKLLDIMGRSRKRQIELADRFSIKDYPCPAGGCLLTCKEFAAKLRDLFDHKEKVGIEDVNLLKIGRHFRFGKNKIVVGRNEIENKQLERMREKDDYCFEVPDCGSPITLLQGPKTIEALRKAAVLTLRYSDKKEGKAMVKFGREKLDKSVVVSAIAASEIEKLRIT
jgi:tRNA U34 2-thiouridine synthase MnmA/TrmU